MYVQVNSQKYSRIKYWYLILLIPHMQKLGTGQYQVMSNVA